MSANLRACASIYVLVDPISQEVRYVGKTIKCLSDRLRVHIWAAKRGNKTHRCNWIRSLLNAGLEPAIREIEMVDGDWAAREQFWIAKFKSEGVRLTNATAGGEGWHGLKHSAETKRKIGDAQRGKTIPPEARKKQAAAMSGRTLSDEHRAKVSAALIGRVVGPEVKAKLSAQRKGVPFPQCAGERNGRAVLTRAQADEIRNSSGPVKRFVLAYGITDTTAYNIRKGVLWK